MLIILSLSKFKKQISKLQSNEIFLSERVMVFHATVYLIYVSLFFVLAAVITVAVV